MRPLALSIIQACNCPCESSESYDLNIWRSDKVTPKSFIPSVVVVVVAVAVAESRHDSSLYSGLSSSFAAEGPSGLK